MFSDSQIRIVEQTPTHFLAYDPPYVVFGIIFVIFGFLIAGLMLFVTWKTGGFKAVYLVGYAASLIILLIGSGAATTKSYISGSRGTGTVRVTKTILGASFGQGPVPLENIQIAKVENVKNLRRVVLVLKSGGVVYLTSSTDRAGYEQLAGAINSLLAH